MSWGPGLRIEVDIVGIAAKITTDRIMPNPQDYVLKLPNVAPAIIREDVVARKGNYAVWPVLQGQSIASVEIPVGKWRAPHLHTNTSEIAVIVQGSGRAGIQSPTGTFEVDMLQGDCVYFPAGWPHWLRNSGTTLLLAYFNYVHEKPETIELATMHNILGELGESDYLETE